MNSSIPVDTEGCTVKILSIEGLIIAKTAAGRPKDAAGLEELQTLLKTANLERSPDNDQ